ncbi:hypothetical protein Chro_2675 [Chroococcidiopsis thermalis PCC 7203]|uniref:DGQHR domain protein n=2 Tax=Chroococcidiopsis thermalis TaxID=54299 RepID=K9U1N2_CHRTP|nr:hypothetical protein Chro_2675 [Chroococcidiopsis thermalis PCC 7203]
MLMFSEDKGKVKFNKPLYGMTGKYTLAEGISLPYFSSLLDIDRAINELRIAEQVPASLEAKWSLKELFQREIDEKRVRQDIVKGYLLDPKKLKFFNAITIVLMPKGADDKILDSFENDSTIPPPTIPWEGNDVEDGQWNHPNARIANFGGVQFISIGLSARLRWDENRVLAVAVDGQHRLSALRTFREDQEFGRSGSLRTHEQETKIPVLFVLLHPDAGFLNVSVQANYSIRRISRELFTDLNKNAKTVDKARELILDDKSINAQCVRTLLTESTTEDIPGLLPLSLVRWQDDFNRFDTSYYLNSLVHLNLLVSEILELKDKELRDPMDKKQVMGFIKSINDALGINGQEVKDGERPLTRYYLEDCCEDEEDPHTPFSRLPEHYLDSAVEGFIVNFRPWLLRLLLDFKPYQELLAYARQYNLIEGNFGKFQAQTSKHKNAILQQENTKDSEWNKREILIPQSAINSMKENQWAFKAIFQKAMIRLGRIIGFEVRSENKNLGNIDDFLNFLNGLYDKGILRVDASLPDHSYRLWTFIALNPGNEKIKVNRAVEDRIFSLLRLWYFGTRKIQIDTAAGEQILSNRKLLQFFAADKNRVHWPGCPEAYETLRKGFDVATLYRKDSNEITIEEKKELVRVRFSAVLAAGLPVLSQLQRGALHEQSSEYYNQDNES